MTIREALLEATQQLELQHISDAPFCAEVLLIHFLKVDRAYLYTHDDRSIPDDVSMAFVGAINQRISGVPMQYVIGHQEFYGRDFIVNPAVLIPRPETEHIVESVLEAKPSADARIIDVGTGSGCIAITLALELPQAKVFASDISEVALSVAKLNSATLEASVAFICMDALDALRSSVGIDGSCERNSSNNNPLLEKEGWREAPGWSVAPEPFDFVVSNPPYVPLADFEHLQREVRDHEPHVALFSPSDALEVYRRLVRSSLELLKPGGKLIMEVGFGMDESVVALLGEGWAHASTKADLQGIPRTVIAERRAGQAKK